MENQEYEEMAKVWTVDEGQLSAQHESGLKMTYIGMNENGTMKTTVEGLMSWLQQKEKAGLSEAEIGQQMGKLGVQFGAIVQHVKKKHGHTENIKPSSKPNQNSR